MSSKHQYRTSKSKVEKIPCPYCNQYDGVKQNLRRHIQDKHPGMPYKRKGESSISELFSKKQKISEHSPVLSTPTLSPGQDSGSGQFDLPQISNLGESSTNISYRDQKINKVLVSEGPSYVSPQQSTLGQSKNKVDISLFDIM